MSTIKLEFKKNPQPDSESDLVAYIPVPGRDGGTRTIPVFPHREKAREKGSRIKDPGWKEVCIGYNAKGTVGFAWLPDDDNQGAK